MKKRRGDDKSGDNRKPPKEYQFKRGQSGNPNGRPRGSKNFTTLLRQALNERVVITENGQRRRITKREAMAKQLANKAASGDPRAAKFLYDLDAKTNGRLGGEPVETKEMGIPYDLRFWVDVIVILRRADALRVVPAGMFEAINTADWAKLYEIVGKLPEDEGDAEAVASEDE